MRGKQALPLRIFQCQYYGFRPGRSAHEAVAQAQACIIEGCGFVVDIGLAKFFDRDSYPPAVWHLNRNA